MSLRRYKGDSTAKRNRAVSLKWWIAMLAFDLYAIWSAVLIEGRAK
jgi:hypothetical protein